MSGDHWLLTLSLGAIGFGLLLGAWAWWIWAAPPVEVEERIEEEAVGFVRVEPAAVAQGFTPVEVIDVTFSGEPVEHVGTNEDPEAFIAEVAEASALMQVKDNLANPLDLDVVIALDRLQGEGYASFAANIDAALARFKAPPVEPHEESSREFLDRAELSAWSSALTGSFKTISLMSDTQEITPQMRAKVLGGVR